MELVREVSQVEKTAGTTNIEKKRVRMGDRGRGMCRARGWGRVKAGSPSCKASCALGSLDSIFKARRFLRSGGEREVSRKGKSDYFTMNQIPFQLTCKP